ncbi:MAG: DUF1257 domain-containing protein [Methanoregula sp.]|nr:MAG: DUF1257 domain-containing protein [Methanoregula sp.]
MSHFSRLKTQFKSREVLTECLQEMGYEIETNRTIKGYAGHEFVDFSIKTKNGYGIGFRLNDQGTYDIIADWWGVRGTKQENLIDGLQERINRIQREYAIRMVMEQTRQNGFEMIERADEKDGSVRIVVRRWA